MIKGLVLIVAAFAAGFVFHAYFFPKLQVTDIKDIVSNPQILDTAKDKLPEKKTKSDFITEVVYKDGKFAPSVVSVTRGNYISITNQDEENQMWLDSDEPLLSTARGYGLSEQVKTTLSEPGTYDVTNALNKKAKLKVTVK